MAENLPPQSTPPTPEPTSQPTSQPAAPAAPAASHHDRVGLLRRVYALIPIVGVLLLSFLAIKYLIVTLLVPQPAPAQVTRIPARLTEEAWKTEPQTWLGQVVAEIPRAPLSHYHHVEGWFQPDPVNDCTRNSSCHAPLPHSKNKADRAFLNMHATSLHCGVCHMQSPDQPLKLVWYNLESGRKTDPPAMLRAYEWLITAEAQGLLARPTPEAQAELVGLLRAAANEAGGDPALTRVADQVAGPRYSSQQFVNAVLLARDRLPLYFRGEYGAKLALQDPQTGGPLLGYPNSADAVRDYLQRGASLQGAELDKLLERVHTQRRATTLQCTACHTPDSSLVDLSRVGYPPERIQTLQQGFIFGAIQDIMAGQPLYLPGFVTPESGNTTSPASEE